MVLIQDPITARRSVQGYQNQDPTFTATRECKFLMALIDAVDAGDLEAFTGAVFEFDQVIKLDNWKTNMLLKIKRSIQDNEPGLT